jgi:microcystin degradation protein MlrC
MKQSLYEGLDVLLKSQLSIEFSTISHRSVKSSTHFSANFADIRSKKRAISQLTVKI